MNFDRSKDPPCRSLWLVIKGKFNAPVDKRKPKYTITILQRHYQYNACKYTTLIKRLFVYLNFSFYEEIFQKKYIYISTVVFLITTET